MNEKTQISLPQDANSTGRSFGQAEIEALIQVIESGTLNRTKGTVTDELEAKFAEFCDRPYCRAVSSGTAAIHAAVAAIDPEPGDEIITTPITDMGGITPILYQSAIPVFADVDPLTYNVTADTIRRVVTPRTKAVIVTHLFGNCCDMAPIVELCNELRIPLIEDCAQAYGATYQGQPVGSIGTIGCFSLQQGKHLTSGEGGLVVTADKDLARRIRLFSDKAWGYGDEKPDHYFVALNYRITELQAAVALAQLEKLPSMIAARVATAELLTARLAEIEGIDAPELTPGSTHVYWRYPLRVDPNLIEGGADELGSLLRKAGIGCSPRYIQKPAFECAVLAERRTFGKSEFPFRGEHRQGAPDVVYSREQTPGTIEALSRVVVLPWNEKYTPDHVDFIAGALAECSSALTAAGVV